MNYFVKSKLFKFIVLILFGFGIFTIVSRVIYPDRINNLSKKNYKLTTRVYVNDNYLRDCITHSNQTSKLVETPVQVDEGIHGLGKFIIIQSEGFLNNKCPYDIELAFLSFDDPITHEWEYDNDWGPHSHENRKGDYYYYIKENTGYFQIKNNKLNERYEKRRRILIPKLDKIPIEIWFFASSGSSFKYKDNWHKDNPEIIFNPTPDYLYLIDRENDKNLWSTLSRKNLVSYVVTIRNPFHGYRKILFNQSGCSVQTQVFGFPGNGFLKNNLIIEDGCKSKKWAIKNKNGEIVENANDYTKYLIETNFNFNQSARNIGANIILKTSKRAFNDLQYK